MQVGLPSACPMRESPSLSTSDARADGLARTRALPFHPRKERILSRMRRSGETVYDRDALKAQGGAS